ncbi:MAG: methylated-DNA--[protein]-cysteine S-methyltransferase [Anaerolineales bacterium]
MSKLKKQASEYTAWVEEHAVPPDELTSALDALYGAGPSAEAAQQARLAIQASLANSLTPIYYDQLEQTPLGPIWLAVGSHGLVAIEYNGSETSFRAALAKLGAGSLQRSAARLAEAKRFVSAYLSGESDRLSLEVDLSHLTAFQRRVLQETLSVPRGQVASYAEIARRIGQPKALRAVGQALRRNPLPIVVPCHRVIAADGSLGGYAGELHSRRKLQLLRLEGVGLAGSL